MTLYMATKRYEKDSKPMTNTRKIQAEEVKSKIILAGLSVFSAQGFDGASLPQIAKLANVSVPLVIYHFKNKQSLWQATVEHAVERFDLELELLMREVNSATEQLSQIIRALVRVSTEFPEFHRLMLLESHKDSDRLNWLCERFANKHNKMMLGVIKRAQAEGTVSKIDSQRLLHAIVGMATISSQAAEFNKITGKNLFSASEMKKTINCIEKLIFIN